LLEIADLMVVTKADRPGAAETRQQLMGAQSLRTGRDGDAQGVPVLMVSSVTREGIGALSDAIAEALPDDRSVHAMHARRKRRTRYLLATECKRLVELSLKSPAAGVDVDEIAGDLMSGAITPQQALRKIIKD
ncbi:MAG: methylmalonyl Co-A mutase-associated GTPase MeaB, partial [Pseudomonadota bacterium]